MSLEVFSGLVAGYARPVILLEGTRALPECDEPRLVAFARQLASLFPHARFRTGNASGSDEAFAEGVCSVDAHRLEYILPHQSMRASSRNKLSPSLSLDEIGEDEEELLALETVTASPKYKSLIGGRKKHSALKVKANYLLRDTLKIMGCEAKGFQPAHIGIFYINTQDAAKGGTGHTIRVCQNKGVAAVTQDVWLDWNLEK